jgi:ribonuclease R
MNLIIGNLQGHADGYGFVISEEEGETDVFIPARAMEGAMHGDRVIARFEKPSVAGKREGRIIQMLGRARTDLVGRFEKNKNINVVVPQEKRISQVVYVTPRNSLHARDGDMVIVKILQYPSKKRNPIGSITKILGHHSDARIDSDLIIESHGLPKTFPHEVLKEAQGLPEKVQEGAVHTRKDLRNLITVTIDGEKAKDFDDAVSAQRLPDGLIRLWVHVADVGHYVPWNGNLDQEALKRGTSIYFPDRVVPMFPEKLSNQICSLNPNEDRLTLTCEMDFDTNGTRTSYQVYESVILSKARMTYTQVKEILQGKPWPEHSQSKNIIALLQILEDLSQRLHQKRRRRGSIDFDLPEPEIILDLQGQVSDILRQERNIAHRIIEECMLAANETVAEHLTNLQTPMVFRIHEEPDADRMRDFNEFIQPFGLYLKGINKIKPNSLQKLLDQAKGTQYEKLINHVLLRSMKQARYSTEKKGHFGLAAEHYTHFTSPIRRYPDLIVHRLLKEVLSNGALPSKRIKHLEEILPGIAKQSSEREREAMEAEREVIDFKKARFMLDKIGEEFDAYITGVTNFGFFVGLQLYFVEGLVHMTSLHDDYYSYVEKQHALVGEHQRRVFRLGDEVRVRVERVDIDQRRIDFSLVDMKQQGEKSKKRKKPIKMRKRKHHP